MFSTNVMYNEFSNVNCAETQLPGTACFLPSADNLALTGEGQSSSTATRGPHEIIKVP